jgi:uncharacterized protein YkwD
MPPSVGIRGERALLLLALVAALAGLAVPAAATSAPSHGARGIRGLSSLEAGVLQQLNGIRVAHGLVPLTLSARLTEASAEHSAEMGGDGYFEHTSHDGTAFWKRIAHFYPQTGYRYWSVGENLLWSSPDVDPAGALKLWMNSPEHRANILTARWREIGVSAVHLADAPGTFNGLPVTIITTDFGVRH